MTSTCEICGVKFDANDSYGGNQCVSCEKKGELRARLDYWVDNVADYEVEVGARVMLNLLWPTIAAAGNVKHNQDDNDSIDELTKALRELRKQIGGEG